MSCDGLTECHLYAKNLMHIQSECIFIYLIALQVNAWVTKDGRYPMPTEEQNCHTLLTVTHDDVTNSVKVIPRLETLVGVDVEHNMLTLNCFADIQWIIVITSKLSFDLVQL